MSGRRLHSLAENQGCSTGSVSAVSPEPVESLVPELWAFTWCQKIDLSLPARLELYGSLVFCVDGPAQKLYLVLHPCESLRRQTSLNKVEKRSFALQR